MQTSIYANEWIDKQTQLSLVKVVSSSIWDIIRNLFSSKFSWFAWYDVQTNIEKGTTKKFSPLNRQLQVKSYQIDIKTGLDVLFFCVPEIKVLLLKCVKIFIRVKYLFLWNVHFTLHYFFKNISKRTWASERKQTNTFFSVK